MKIRSSLFVKLGCVALLVIHSAHGSRIDSFGACALLIHAASALLLSPLPFPSSFSLPPPTPRVPIGKTGGKVVGRSLFQSEPVSMMAVPQLSAVTLEARASFGDEPPERSVSDNIDDDIVTRVVKARIGDRDHVEDCLAKYRHGWDEFALYSYKNKEIPETFRMQYFQLVKRNMQAMYEYSTWGWADERKWKDVVNPNTRFVVAVKRNPFSSEEEVVGGVLYGFELHNRTDTTGSATSVMEPHGVLFLYEFQVAEGYRGRGLGKHLMAVMESIAANARLDRVMLCVFRFNKPALAFYLNAARYKVDWDCPHNYSQNQTYWVAKEVPDNPQVSCLFLMKGQHPGWVPGRVQGRRALGVPSIRAGTDRQQPREATSTDGGGKADVGVSTALQPEETAAAGGGGVEGGSVLGAALLFAGTAIGAGMLALPAETARAGFWPSEASLIFCWAFTVVTALVTLEASWAMNSAEEDEAAGVGFVTMAGKAFGAAGQAVTAGLLWFLLTSILVAYTAAGGDSVSQLAQAAGVAGVGSKTGGVLYMSAFAALAVAGTKSVDSLNRVLVAGLVVTFGGLVACGLPLVQPALLERAEWGAVWPAGVSIGILSFGAQNVVPTLFEYLDRDPLRTRTAIVLGASLPLVMYSAWECVFLGVIPYAGAPAQSDILQALGRAAGSGLVGQLAAAFSVCAIGSSTAGASVSFVDFFADSFPSPPSQPSNSDVDKSNRSQSTLASSLQDSLDTDGVDRRRLVAAAAALLPPLGFALTNEGAFLTALENAGVLGGVTLYGLLPALMVLRIRADRAHDEDQAAEMPGRLPGGAAALLVLAAGSCVLIVPELVRVVSSVVPH